AHAWGKACDVRCCLAACNSCDKNQQEREDERFVTFHRNALQNNVLCGYCFVVTTRCGLLRYSHNSRDNDPKGQHLCVCDVENSLPSHRTPTESHVFGDLGCSLCHSVYRRFIFRALKTDYFAEVALDSFFGLEIVRSVAASKSLSIDFF